MKSISRWTLALMLLTGFFWSVAAQATTPLCTINGGSTYTDCVAPAIVWTASDVALNSSFYATPEDSAKAYFDWSRTYYAHRCDYGCSLTVEDETGSSKLIHKLAVVSASTSSGGTNTYVGNTTQKPICPPNYGTVLNDHDPTGQWTVYACRPSGTYAATVTRADTKDTSNPEGCPKGCNPVDLSDLHKKDHAIDYQNASPYPIVWERFWNGRVNQWFFNYDRRLLAAVLGSDPNQANVTLRRQDGQTLSFHGVLNAGVWTWSPNLGTVTKNNMALVSLQSNAALTTFTVLNHLDETETYNAQGQLIALQDIRALPLTFTYDALNRLDHIADASGRSLTISYPDASPGTQVTIKDKDGNDVPYSFHSYEGAGAAQADLFPEIVSDGNLAIGYVVVPNPAGGFQPSAVLSQVILPDSTVLTYNYDSSGNYTGLTDENNDRFSTYTYSGTKMSKTVHGVGQETIQYSSTKVTFPNGQFTTYGKDSASLKNTSMNQRCAWCTGYVAKTTTYDAAGNPTSITDFDNHTQTRVYDQARGVPTSITEASGTSLARTTTLTWDSRFLKPTVITKPVQTPAGAGSSTTTNAYDVNGNLTAWSVAVTGPSSYSLTRSGSATYNAFSEPLTITDARGKVTTFTYDTQGNRLTQVDALGHTTTYGNYDPAGNLGSITDPNGLTTTFTYDGRQRITQTQRGCALAGCHWETTTVTYNPMGAIAKVVGPNGRGVAYHYDTAHRRTSEDVLDTSGAVLGTLTYTLSVSSEVTAKTYTDASGATIQTQGLGYDALSRLTAVIDSHTKTFGQTWDAQDHLTNTTDPLSHNKVLAYDALDRLTQTTLPDTTTEGVGYGPDDTVTSQTDAAGHTTTQTFNGFGEVLTRQSPDSGLTTITRNANGNALTQTDARGKVLTTTYDDLDRPLTQTGSTGGVGEHITWSYDSCTYGVGHVCSVTDRTGSTAFTYDRWGRVASQTQITNAHTFTTLYGYDTAGQLTALTYPSGQVLTQTWTQGRVTSQQWGLAPGAGPAIFTGAQYDPWDKLLGWTWASGRAYSIAYDLDGRVSAVGTGAGPTKQTYSFDDAWRLTGVTRQPAAITTAFGYDTRDRLTSGSTWGSYTYDANSNRLTWLGTLGPQSYGMMLGTNRLATINSASVTTDAAGNLTSKPGLALIFDDWSRLRTATASGTTTTYGVNGLNERVAKTTGTSTWVYVYASPGHLLGVYDGTTGAAQEELAYLGERPVATARSGIVYPIETDHLMAPLRVLDASNTTVWSWEDREPFGATAPVEGTVGGQPFSLGLRFPGQWADRESGLVSNGFRDYDPSLGQYVEVDPLGLEAGMNTYAYVGGDPLGFTDPYGLSSHRYTVTDYICSESQSGCTMKNVFNRLRQYPAPFSDPSFPINNGDIENIPGLGPIAESVDPSNCLITNTTLPGHLLYPGQVTRTVVNQNGEIAVVTVGTGDGNFATLNDWLATPLWNTVDGNISAPWIAASPYPAYADPPGSGLH